MKRRDTIVRYTAPERINHWITAFCFILAAVSGLGFLFPSFNWLMQIMGTHVFPLLASQPNQSG